MPIIVIMQDLPACMVMKANNSVLSAAWWRTIARDIIVKVQLTSMHACAVIQSLYIVYQSHAYIIHYDTLDICIMRTITLKLIISGCIELTPFSNGVTYISKL